MQYRSSLAIILLLAAVACSDDDAKNDAGPAADTGLADTGGGGDSGTPPDQGKPTGLPEVAKVALVGAALDAKFKTNGLVRFTLLPTTKDGKAVLDPKLLVAAVAKTPTGLSAAVDKKEKKEPPKGQPLIAGLLFDSSGSMSGNDPLRLRVKAAEQFIDQLDADDQVAVADFGAGKSHAFKVTRLLENFTKDKTKAKAALLKLKSSGSTPMFQSVSEVLVAMNLGFPATKYPHRALVVLGDGQPNGSGTLLGSCTWAKTTKIPVNTIGFGPAAWQHKKVDWTAVWNLGALAGCSGGAYSSVAAAKDLSKTYLNISTLLKKGAMIVTVKFSPIPKTKLVTGTLSASNGAQTPAQVAYTFWAP